MPTTRSNTTGANRLQMDEAPLNDLWSLDPATEAWARVEAQAGAPPSPRSFHSATAIGDKLYVFGGCGEAGRLSDLHEFCTTTVRRPPHQAGAQPLHGSPPHLLCGSRLCGAAHVAAAARRADA